MSGFNVPINREIGTVDGAIPDFMVPASPLAVESAASRQEVFLYFAGEPRHALMARIGKPRETFGHDMDRDIR